MFQRDSNQWFINDLWWLWLCDRNVFTLAQMIKCDELFVENNTFYSVFCLNCVQEQHFHCHYTVQFAIDC